MSSKYTDQEILDKVSGIENKLSVLNEYLSQNGEIVIDLVMRIASLEKVLVAKGVLTEQEVQDTVNLSYKELISKTADVTSKTNPISKLDAT
jgi:hypothetical protein